MSSNNKYYREAIRVLDIMAGVCKEKGVYSDEKKRRKIDRFMNRTEDEELRKNISDIGMHYFGKINRRKMDDPKNDVVVEEVVQQIEALKKEIKKRIK